MKIQIASASDFGRERTNNEDQYSWCPSLSAPQWKQGSLSAGEADPAGTILVVCDGMGGQNAGEVASAIAVESMHAFFSKAPDLSSEELIRKHLPAAILQAHQQILDHSRNHPETRNMGTTCVLALIKNEKAYVSWAGDSRAYWFGEKAGLRQVTRDHSLVQQLIDKGQLTEEQAFYHPQSNVIMQSLGDPSLKLKPGFVIQDLYDDDILFLCSDGLNGMLQNVQIEKGIRSENDLDKMCAHLIQAANEAGGHDNITLLMCRVSETGKSDFSAVNTLEPGMSATHPHHKRKHSVRNVLILLTLVILAAAVLFLTRRSTSEGKAGKKDTLKLAPMATDTLPVQKKAPDTPKSGNRVSPNSRPPVITLPKDTTTGNKAKAVLTPIPGK